ncbi:hypothetical protein [Nostoc sp. FACHB-280]|uniref:hypothetical protein n=1 Tax=Nostoc sp. FACHB-280 TaxID=2692839 RepID=UPI0037CB80F9
MAWNPGQHLFGDRYTIERQLGEDGITLTYLSWVEKRRCKAASRRLTQHPQDFVGFRYRPTQPFILRKV